MYSRSISGKNAYRRPGPPPNYGGTSVRNTADTPKEKNAGYRSGKDIETKTRVHPPVGQTAAPDAAERLSGRRPIGRNIGMSIIPGLDPEPEKDRPPELCREDCSDDPEQHDNNTENRALHRFSGSGTAADDILLAALIAMLFGSRADDELLLILVLIYIFGFAEK